MGHHFVRRVRRVGHCSQVQLLENLHKILHSIGVKNLDRTMIVTKTQFYNLVHGLT
jgi:hypothetical protein